MLINIFPKPSGENNEKIKKMIMDRFKDTGLTFHTMMRYFDDNIEMGDKELAMISGYYTCNVLLRHNGCSDENKTEIMRVMFERIQSMND
jgi:translation elongation factor EF-4